MKKRTWHYTYPPAHYGVTCDKCGGHNIQWSEFAHKIWCYDCKIDTDGDEGIFGGPVPVQTTMILLGPDCFDRVSVKTGKVTKFVVPGQPVGGCLL